MAVNWAVEAGETTLPCSGHVACGDLLLHRQTGEAFLALLIDVAGHGSEAAATADKVRAQLWPLADEAPETVLQRCHELLRGTQGAVGLALRADLQAGKLAVAAVGNVAWGAAHDGVPMPAAAGQLGLVMPQLRPVERPVREGEPLLFCTDGLRSAMWRWFAQSSTLLTADELARRAVLQFQRRHDDAACLALRFGRVFESQV